MWNDSSGIGNNLSGGASVDYNSTGLNGKPSVNLNSTSSLFTNNSPVGVSSLSKYSFVATLSPANIAGGSKGILQLLPGAGCASNSIEIERQGANLRSQFCPGSQANSPVSAGGNYVYSSTWDNSVGVPQLRGYINGSPSGTGNQTGMTPVVTQILLGGTPTNSFQGQIGDLLFFTDSLFFNTSVYGSPWTDQRIVECYLSAKYGVALATGVTCP